MPKSALCKREAHCYEFVLLSVDSGKRDIHFISDDEVTKRHLDQPPRVNIMLIQWRETQEGKSFAVRVALASVDESAWDEVETTEKQIVLG